jgi:hypothetical protein
MLKNHNLSLEYVVLYSTVLRNGTLGYSKRVQRNTAFEHVLSIFFSSIFNEPKRCSSPDKNSGNIPY